ncbi:hypothetical protein AA313_de0203543 [Arthrobotrys entomopaga]|nr:hypothetical protein AA313_de0203543 [Arthrobotrys entomopaga]
MVIIADMEIRVEEKQDKCFPFFHLPLEIRNQIYDMILPVAINFIYESPWIFKTYNDSKQNMKNYTSGLRYKIVPSDHMTTRFQYYDKVDTRLGYELRENYNQKYFRALGILAECRTMPSTNPWNRQFNPVKITQPFLDLISSSSTRFIIASFGHNTANTITGLDSRIKERIRNIFITHTMISSALPGNKNKWHPSTPSHLIIPDSQESDGSDVIDGGEMSDFERLLSTHLPNLKTVALSIRHHWNDLDALRTMLRWFDTSKIETLELIYPTRPPPYIYNYDPEIKWKSHSVKKQPTVEDVYEVLYDFAYRGFGRRDPAKKWRVEELSSEEVDSRGRFLINWGYPSRCNDELNMVEGAVFRLVRGDIMPSLDGPKDAMIDLEPLRERTEDEMAFFEATKLIHSLEI